MIKQIGIRNALKRSRYKYGRFNRMRAIKVMVIIMVIVFATVSTFVLIYMESYIKAREIVEKEEENGNEKIKEEPKTASLSVYMNSVDFGIYAPEGVSVKIYEDGIYIYTLTTLADGSLPDIDMCYGTDYTYEITTGVGVITGDIIGGIQQIELSTVPMIITVWHMLPTNILATNVSISFKMNGIIIIKTSDEITAVIYLEGIYGMLTWLENGEWKDYATISQWTDEWVNSLLLQTEILSYLLIYYLRKDNIFTSLSQNFKFN